MPFLLEEMSCRSGQQFFEAEAGFVEVGYIQSNMVTLHLKPVQRCPNKEVEALIIQWLIGSTQIHVSELLERKGGVKNDFLDEFYEVRVSRNLDQSFGTMDGNCMAATLDKVVDKAVDRSLFQFSASRTQSF